MTVNASQLAIEAEQNDYFGALECFMRIAESKSHSINLVYSVLRVKKILVIVNILDLDLPV